MNERALFGAMFTVGVVTALVAGLAGWQLGRSRTAPPAVSSSTAMPPSGREAETAESLRPSSDVPVARPAAPQRAADESAVLAPPAIDLPPQSAREAASADLAPPLAASRPPGSEPQQRTVVRETRSDPVSPTRPTDPPAQARSAASPTAEPAKPELAINAARAPAAGAASPDATATPLIGPAAPPTATESRSAALMPDRSRPAAGSAAAPLSTELSVAERAKLVAPTPADADRRPVQLLAALAVPLLRADSAPAAVPAPAPPLRAPAEAPFVVSVTQGEEGDIVAGAVAAPASTARPVPDRAATPTGAAPPAAQTRSDPARFFPPAVTLEAALPAGPPPTAATEVAPRLGAATPAPVEAEVTAAIPDRAVVAPPAPPLSVKPRKGGRPPEKRRRVAAFEPEAPAAGHRVRSPRPHFTRSRLMMEGEFRPRARVRVIYGTMPRREVGPVLIRIHAAGNGRIRTSRIPLY
jgi:hypothetical protein